MSPKNMLDFMYCHLRGAVLTPKLSVNVIMKEQQRAWSVTEQQMWGKNVQSKPNNLLHRTHSKFSASRLDSMMNLFSIVIKKNTLCAYIHYMMVIITKRMQICPFVVIKSRCEKAKQIEIALFIASILSKTHADIFCALGQRFTVWFIPFTPTC